MKELQMGIINWRAVLALASILIVADLELIPVAEATQRNCRGDNDNSFLADEIVNISLASRDEFLAKIEDYANSHGLQLSSSKNLKTGAISMFLEPVRPAGIIVEVSDNESLGQFHVRVRTCSSVGDWHSVWERVLNFVRCFQTRS